MRGSQIFGADQIRRSPFVTIVMLGVLLTLAMMTAVRAMATPSYLPTHNADLNFPAQAAQEYWACDMQGVIGPQSGIVRQLVEVKPDGRAYDPFSQLPVRELTTLERHATKGCKYAVDRSVTMAPKTIALTYDDGPDPVWSDQIMDVLESNNVRGTFFTVGQNVQAQPDIFARMVDRHSVGSHTMSHANVSDSSSLAADKIRQQIVSSARVLASHGATSKLFRLPYTGDDDASSVRSVGGIAVAQQLGTPQIGFTYDSHDYSEYGQNANVSDLKLDGESVMIVMHDSGGDRSNTVELTREIIAKAKAAGYTFVTVDEILHPVSAATAQPTFVDQVANWAAGFQAAFPKWMRLGMMLSIGYGMALGLSICVLSIYASHTLWRRHKFNQASQWWNDLDSWSPWPKLATVLIAAYNEEATIGSTLDSILRYQYPFAVEVVVVNDGSRDGTKSIIDAYAAATKDSPIRVRAIHRRNSGKSAALNHALMNPSIVRGDSTVFIDADTLVRKHTIPNLVRPLADPRVGAVSGRIAVQNMGEGWFAKLITRWQQEDYTVGMAVARMAQSLFGVVMVLSGACSACRTSAIREIGGFATDTMAEDADAGWQLQRAGYKIANAPHAVADTQVPETAQALVRQQFRWHFGILQVMYKHREVLRHPLGNSGQAFIMGYSLINALMPLLAPYIWLVIFGALWQGRWEITLGYYALFTSVRIVTAFVAMYNVRELSWNPLWSIFHRVINDPLQVIVTYRSLFAALSGRLVSWGHVPRQAIVI